MKTIKVSAAIIHKDGYLYATRRACGNFKGLWEFPGGKQEFGESSEDALLREIKEELNVDIKIERFLCTINYSYPEFDLVMDCYLCKIASGELHLSVHDDAKWVSIKDLNTLSWLPADILVVKEIEKGSALFL